MYHFYVQDQGNGMEKGAPVPATMTEQTLHLDLQTKLIW